LSQTAILALSIFIITYIFIILEKIHRTIVAMIGGLSIIVFGILTQEQAIDHIDFNTIGLLIGMMVIVSITSETGLFHYIAVWSAKKVQADPIKLLIVLSLITAFGSAFLDNVTTVLLIVPMTFSITNRLNVNPVPYLLGEVFASNIGGTATLIGDPPNMMIGSAVKELTFLSFLNNLAPVCFLVLLVTIVVLVFLFRKQLTTSADLKEKLLALDEKAEITDSVLLKKCLAALLITIAGFFFYPFLHVETAVIALLGAFILLLWTEGKYLELALKKVEWTTLFFFIGLFVIVGGLVETGLISALGQKAVEVTGGNVTFASFLILWLSAIVSAFVDNIPFVSTMIPLVKTMGDWGVSNLEPLWWSLSLGACLGGNGTLIGASANLIVAGLAAQRGIKITFASFLKIGFPLMILSILISSVYIYLRYLW
jgi:Na+/H+ antiporter NhaD/arsenite permease-like protein